MHHLDALSFFQVCLGSKFWLSLLGNVGFRDPARCVRDFCLMSAPPVKTGLLPDALQLLMLFVWM
jgi:hypothetical protein